MAGNSLPENKPVTETASIPASRLGSSVSGATTPAGFLIRRIAVLGAGNMGSQIAAHIANAGFPVLMLDLASEGDRNRIALRALESLKKAKPAPLASPELAANIHLGNFDDDLEKIGDCDWVIEAVAEDLEVKRGLIKKAARYLRSDAILTTNTSGLPISTIAQGFEPDLRRRVFGTHFFNPPRYMQLLEVIATPESNALAIASVSSFADLHLGKTVVSANDTPGFIANRIGTFALLNTVAAMGELGLSIEEVDTLTGTPLGWPKTGTFRLADLVGIDVLASVVRNFGQSVRDERADVHQAELFEPLLKRGWLGDKAGQGFYKKQSAKAEGPAIFALDLKSLEYHAASKPKFAEIEIAKNVESLPERIRMLLGGDPNKGKVAAFYWKVLPELWTYAANRIGEVSDNPLNIDNAMRAGFNWTFGPFEMWDAAGVAETVERMRTLGKPVPEAAERLLASGNSSWYRKGGTEYFDPSSGGYRPVPHFAQAISVLAAKRSRGVVRENAGVSLVDIGDGIGCIEFHSKMNTLGQDAVGLIREVLSPASAEVQSFQGFIVANDAANFSAGANLMQLLLAAQDEEWDEIDLYIQAFQQMTQAVKFCPRPVVSAPFGLCLGGGTEISLHAAARQAHLELYMGLVEAGVGLVPAGGGCKESTLYVIEQAAEVRNDPRGDSVEVYDALRRRFELIAMAKASTSAVEAMGWGFLSQADGITMNRRRLIEDAKRKALLLAGSGYAPPLTKTQIALPGESALASLKMAIHMMREGQFISDHDVTIARHIAHILCGGAVPAGTRAGEQYLLDLEREAFLSLCGEAKTQERIAFTLKTGKPLRN